jgi:beta-phosphoglucomutase
MQPTALIFDMDGVLVDTLDYHFRAWQKVAEAGQAPFTRRDMDVLRRRSRLDCLRCIFPGRDLSDAEITALLAIKDRTLSRALRRLSARDILPGVCALLDEARAAHLKLAVASSSIHAKRILRQVGLWDHFDAVADAFTVSRLKPEPDIFVWAAGALRASLGEVAVFEDSTAGVQAAQTVGIFTVGVGEWDLVGRADLFVPTLADLHLADVVRAFRGERRVVEQPGVG